MKRKPHLIYRTYRAHFKAGYIERTSYRELTFGWQAFGTGPDGVVREWHGFAIDRAQAEKGMNRETSGFRNGSYMSAATGRIERGEPLKLDSVEIVELEIV